MKRVKITLPKGGSKAFSNERDDFPPVTVSAHTVVYEGEEIIIEGDVTLNQTPAITGDFRIPFDLQAAKAGSPIVTRDGRTVRFLAHVPEAVSNVQVLAYIQGEDGAREFSASGKARPHSGEALDLFMAPKEKKVRYLNIMANNLDKYAYHSRHYATKEEAEETAKISSQVKWAAIAYPIIID